MRKPKPKRPPEERGPARGREEKNAKAVTGDTKEERTDKAAKKQRRQQQKREAGEQAGVMG